MKDLKVGDTVKVSGYSLYGVIVEKLDLKYKINMFDYHDLDDKGNPKVARGSKNIIMRANQVTLYENN